MKCFVATMVACLLLVSCDKEKDNPCVRSHEEPKLDISVSLDEEGQPQISLESGSETVCDERRDVEK